MASHPFNRRQFLKSSVAAAGSGLMIPYVVGPAALGRDGQTAPSERIILGAIGVGPQGTGVMHGFMGQGDCRVVAVCDVKSNVLEDRRQLVNAHYGNNDCRKYADFRELLARDDIDAVLIATCDHWHVLCGLYAAKARKDMYIEKPMGVSVAEGQALRRVIHRYGRVFQFGTQQRSSRQFWQACMLARNGLIGELKEIRVWSPGSSQGGDPTPVPVPEWLDYDRWLGPAPFTPYTKDRESNALWWFIYDYALGFIAGWGIHPIDIALWGGGEKTACACSVEGTATFPTQGVCNTAMNWDVKIDYDSGVRMHFTGDPFPEAWKQRYGRTTSHGTAFEGTDGWVHVDRGGINAEPKSLLQIPLNDQPVQLPQSNHHQRNLLDCIKTRGLPVSSIDESVQADFVCQISDIATRVGTKLRWDPKTERFLDNDAANRRLSRSMRSPWSLNV